GNRAASHTFGDGPCADQGEIGICSTGTCVSLAFALAVGELIATTLSQRARQNDENLLRKEAGQEDPEGERRVFCEVSGKKIQRRNRTFKPPNSPHFQIGADTTPEIWGFSTGDTAASTPSSNG